MRLRLLIVATAVCLAVPASASASALHRTAPPPKPAPRIVNGTQAGASEYPAQGFVLVDVDPGAGQTLAQCGGTLVGTRQFLTAAHCAVDDADHPLPPGNFNIYLGENDSNNFGSANRHFVTKNDVNADYDASTHQNDTSMLTLSAPVSFAPARVVEPGDEQLWEPGTIARIVGWGTTCSTACSTSRFLLKADVPIVTDQRCSDAYAATGSQFDPATMVCAADAVATPPTSSHDTCQGDSGGPLYVPDYGSTPQHPIFATAGVVSWGISCANPSFPGVYARIGEGPVNDWTLARIPRADYDIDPFPPVAGEPATFFSTSTHPEGAGYFTQYNWDLDQDGQFDDKTGEEIQVQFQAPGEHVVGLEASRPGGDRSSVYYSFDVAPGSGGSGNHEPPVVPQQPAVTTSGGGQPLATTTTTTTGPQVARLIVAKSVRARGGRFKVKVAFPASATAGTVVLKVLLKGKKIGSARVPIKPGGTSIAKVKLTKAGLRKLRKAKKLKVTLRMSGGGVTAKRTLTLRR